MLAIKGRGRDAQLCAAAALLTVLGLPGLAGRGASAETLPSALVQAYQNNPQLNAQRASARATDEAVPQALSGYRPRLSVTASVGEQYTSTTNKSVSSTGVPSYSTTSGAFTPYTFGASVTQTLFNGFQTANRTRAAEGQVSSAREALRVLEQTILLNAATVYMDMLRDSAIAEVQRSNVRVLNETLRQTRDRFSVGEVTRTDVAQSEAQLAAGQFQLLNAESNLTTTRSNYRRIIGTDPGNLSPGTPMDRFAPSALPAAVSLGLARNPNVTSAMYGIDVAYLQVKINEGALYPTFTFTGSALESISSSLTNMQQTTLSATGNLTVPIYQGGAEYSLIRQSKESLTQQRLNLEQVRDQTRQSVVQAWGQVQATKAQIQSAQAQVNSTEIALNGVREEARVGQRTTLDVLNAQQALVNARVTLVTAQHDRVVASFNLLNAVGVLSPQTLGLATPTYDPRVHYYQVRDSWTGVRTPDGK
ncbi:MAG: outer membrane protein [Alphaproteobacteria bacterium]|jgi:outer membrane protein|nr:outer membrane protein [Alphaproteobacteria bacterium]